MVPQRVTELIRKRLVLQLQTLIRLADLQTKPVGRWQGRVSDG
jgi:hypothetical protein